MHHFLKLSFAVLFVAFAPVANGQDISAEDAIRNTVLIEQPVYFRSVEGERLRVEPGLYWVTPGEESLDLLRLQDGTAVTVRAVSEELSESPEESMAVSTPGTEEQPDTHSVAYMRSDGTQLVAEGSYSEIEARSALSDAARRRAAEARARAQQAALEAKRRAQAAAAEVQRRAQEAAARVREAARNDLRNMLREIAETEQREGRRAALALAGRYSPRLAAASAASFSAEQRRQIMQAGLRELQIHAPFIREVLGRTKNVANLIRDGRDRLSDSERSQLREAIFGSGPDALQHPFANRAVTARGLDDNSGPSWSTDLGGDLAVIAGISISAAQSFPLNPMATGTCTYISASVDFGAQEESEGTGSVGFFVDPYDGLGASRGNWLGGLEVSVNLGGTVVAGAEVVLLFGISDEALSRIALTGIQVGVSGGQGGEVTMGIGYGIRVACL